MIVIVTNTVQIIKLIMIWGDINEMIDNLSTATIPITVVVIKMIICISRKKGIF
jgi:hypothetical protein